MTQQKPMSPAAQARRTAALSRVYDYLLKLPAKPSSRPSV